MKAPVKFAIPTNFKNKSVFNLSPAQRQKFESIGIAIKEIYEDQLEENYPEIYDRSCTHAHELIIPGNLNLTINKVHVEIETMMEADPYNNPYGYRGFCRLHCRGHKACKAGDSGEELFLAAEKDISAAICCHTI